MTSREDLEDQFRRHHGHLVAVAYSLLGSLSEAEDAVQEVWLRVTSRPDHGAISDPRAWLSVVTSNVCLDVLKSARARRERYVGEWLPEPVVEQADPADRVTLDESVHMALLVVLESLSPAERTAFVLHEVFGMPFETIAGVVGRTPAACRKLASRARARVKSGSPRFDADPVEHRRVTAAFARAATAGDLEGLLATLDPEVVLRSDGGAGVPAARRPLVGVTAVARLVRRIMQLRPDTVLEVATVNGTPGLVSRNDGRVSGVISLAVHAGRITEMHFQMNPDKLSRVP